MSRIDQLPRPLGREEEGNNKLALSKFLIIKAKGCISFG